MAAFQNRTVLEEAATEEPIEQGKAVVGWLKFHMPRYEESDTILDNSVEFHDYLEHKSYVVWFTP